MKANFQRFSDKHQDLRNNNCTEKVTMLKKYGVCKSIIREREKPRQNEEKRTSGCKRRAMDRDEWGALRPEIN